MQILLPRDVQYIIDTIRRHGHEAYAVGGCVRDSLLSQQPADYDIATSMRPPEVKKLFKRSFDTGIKHGTVTVVLNRVNYEVTTYRLDGEYLDGRRPESVTFTRDIRDDLARRDFTINAMAYNDERGLVDFFGGLEDLQHKIIRAVGEPVKRFTEDALRMLRAVRFAAQLGFTIEEGTLAAINEFKDNLALISAERIREEFVKLLLSPHPQTGVLLAETGLMEYVIKGRRLKEDFDAAASKAGENHQSYGTSLRTALRRVSACPVDVAMRVALFADCVCFGQDDGGGSLLRDLRFDNATIREVSVYLKYLHTPVRPERYSVKKYMALMPEQWFFNLLTLRRITGLNADTAEAERVARDIIAKGECYTLGGLAVNGSDLIKAGVPAGRAVGDMLAYLLDETQKQPALNEKRRLLEMVGGKVICGTSNA
jgi:tRNA nucleotidyltransferase (CCA-adding enzyme)